MLDSFPDQSIARQYSYCGIKEVGLKTKRGKMSETTVLKSSVTVLDRFHLPVNKNKSKGHFWYTCNKNRIKWNFAVDPEYGGKNHRFNHDRVLSLFFAYWNRTSIAFFDLWRIPPSKCSSKSSLSQGIFIAVTSNRHKASSPCPVSIFIAAHWQEQE